MTTLDRTRLATRALPRAAPDAITGLAPSADHDINLKLILCLPGGFPAGCGDAFDHMVDRLRDGRSPIGSCAMSNGDAYDADEIDHGSVPPTERQECECPPGKTLRHRVHPGDDGRESWTVRTFCHDAARTQAGWAADGSNTVTTYTNKAPPARRGFWVNLTLEPGTAAEFSPGWQGFDTGRGSRVRVGQSS